MVTNILFGLWIFYVIAILVMYHKVFDVVYFDLGRGLMKELVIAAFGGMILAAITVKFWVLSAIIIIITGLVCRGKFDDPAAKNTVLVIAIIIAIVISSLGIKVNKNQKQQDANNETTVSQEEQNNSYNY